MKIRLLELCAGYGSQALALKNLGLEVYSEIAEFDKYASQAYMQLHGETKNYGDVYTIDEKKLPDFDIITYSTPCQDFSAAGNQAGGDKGSGTRSSLLWECERIIRAVKPKYLLMENVKNLLSKKHRHNFNEWFKVLEDMGYTNYYKVLNAKDYGIPQNRERIFCVSILGGGQYLFPTPIPLEKRLKDILEPIVDEKYYLSYKAVKTLFSKKDGCGYKPAINKEAAVTITTKSGQRASDNYIKEPVCAASRGRNPKNPSDRTAGSPTEQRLEINTSGCSNTLTSVQKDNYVVEPSGVVQLGNIVDTGNWNNPQRDGFKENCPSLRATDYKCPHCYSDGYRIRKLTPRECWRLMGVKDEQFDKLHDISNTQLYKLAGNSIVVDVLEAIFKNLFLPEQTDTTGQLTLI